MNNGKSSLITALMVGVAALFTATPAHAQAWHYPTFQPPIIFSREFNFAVAGGGDGYGTSGLVQWREGIGPDTHFAFDGGFADPDAGDTGFLIGGGIAQRLVRSTQETPIDVLLTGGIYGFFSGTGSFVRLPIGVSVGHRFPLQGTTLALTPFAHPRLSIDVCASDCDRPGANDVGTELKVNFDFGADLEVSRVLSLRGALTVGGVSEGDSEVGVGFGMAFRPTPLGPRR